VTKIRSGSPYKWPLSKLIPLKKYYEVKRLLQSLGWTKKSLTEVRKPFIVKIIIWWLMSWIAVNSLKLLC